MKPFDNSGNLTKETVAERAKRKPWPGAWRIPIIIIGGEISKLELPIEGFEDSIIYRLRGKSLGEANFVIKRQIDNLKGMKEYSRIMDFGFKEEPCLANMAFIKQYVDKS